MTGTPTVYVDFNRRDPRVPNRFYASLHRLPDPELGAIVRATDCDEFEVLAQVVAIDHAAGLLVIDVADDTDDDRSAGPALEAFFLGGELVGRTEVKELQLTGGPH